ncbi:hypothetical protein HPB50_023454 [Hyalomma asiaticum]|uniref:Uncharacterized protein n=1 Tax=Hyalomma asiaticum TaxID=266040 RepID=A0ACB7TMR0_HYAAI|nr:hypothetical protein HPB50_023454 [Hyalomma asiaticum]
MDGVPGLLDAVRALPDAGTCGLAVPLRVMDRERISRDQDDEGEKWGGGALASSGTRSSGPPCWRGSESRFSAGSSPPLPSHVRRDGASGFLSETRRRREASFADPTPKVKGIRQPARFSPPHVTQDDPEGELGRLPERLAEFCHGRPVPSACACPSGGAYGCSFLRHGPWHGHFTACCAGGSRGVGKLNSGAAWLPYPFHPPSDWAPVHPSCGLRSPRPPPRT